MGHPFKKFFLLETVDIGGALYVYSLGGVFALSIGVVLFSSSKIQTKRSNIWLNIVINLNLI